jgi:hypothetical protein
MPDGQHYEVVDAKLARTAKARAVLQTALYSRLLAELQGPSRAEAGSHSFEAATTPAVPHGNTGRLSRGWHHGPFGIDISVAERAGGPPSAMPSRPGRHPTLAWRSLNGRPGRARGSCSAQLGRVAARSACAVQDTGPSSGRISFPVRSAGPRSQMALVA